MISVNKLKKINCNKRDILEPLIILLSPFAPFICEELWDKLNPGQSVFNADFPNYHDKYISKSDINYPIAINGKKRLNLIISDEVSKKDLEDLVLANKKVVQLTAGKMIEKIIIIPGKIINIVAINQNQ
tara:strand:- start:900 stop:1286 length:387 start_codon:yes stop_codon:yes gene_type:complete